MKDRLILVAAAMSAATLFAAIELPDVSGTTLRAVASFDANNVRLGDPMTLTVDFIGEANFTSLHPPHLAKAVDGAVWKVDDKSAKTYTYRDARRLEYRVRPLKGGVLIFPSLEFSCRKVGGGEIVVSTMPMPVHVREGVQAVLAGLDDETDSMPMPDGISLEAPGDLPQDDVFAWRKACRVLDPELFAKFDFPRARLNEAACRTMKGEWAKALSIYSRVEWLVGQTPEVERGIVAALARKTGDPFAQLPAWRVALRSVLKYGWRGRAAFTLLLAVLVVAMFFVAGKIVRIVAVAAVIVSLPAAADIFDELDRLHEEMRRSALGVAGRVRIAGSGGEAMRDRSGEIKLTAKLPRKELKVGEKFDLELELFVPRGVALDNLRFSVSNLYALSFPGNAENYPDAKAPDGSNTVKRIVVPMRYDAPVELPLVVSVSGMCSTKTEESRSSFSSFFSYSKSFSVASNPVDIKVSPLDAKGRPEGYSGIVGHAESLTRSLSRRKVCTNNVIVVSWHLKADGFVPENAFKDELTRINGMYTWRTYFVADGTPSIPEGEVAYYDVDKKAYETVKTPAVKLFYVPDDDAQETGERKAVDASGESGRVSRLRFAPADDAPVVAVSQVEFESMRVTGKDGDWVRVDDGQHAGWIRRGEGK